MFIEVTKQDGQIILLNTQAVHSIYLELNDETSTVDTIIQLLNGNKLKVTDTLQTIKFNMKSVLLGR